MSSALKPERPSQSGLAGRLEGLRQELARVSAEVIAERAGVNYHPLGQDEGEFRLAFFGAPVVVTYPSFVVIDYQDKRLPLPSQAALAYYFHTSDGTPLSGEWISFAELPDGRTYNQAFQGYSGDELVRVFGEDVEAFKNTCEKSGGAPMPFGDAGFIFYALPRLPLLVTYWRGEDVFPSSCKMLFDRVAFHYMPTDVCAILGGMLARRLVKAVGEAG